MKNKKSFGFTLAEVLITLGIIGVVAALTIPQVVKNYKEKATVAHLKKTYSVMEQAWSRISLDYGDISDWGLTVGDEDILIDRIAIYFNATQVCHSDELAKCVPNVMYLTSIGTNHLNYIESMNDGPKRAALKLTDGSVMMINFRPLQNVEKDGKTLQIYIDLNAGKKPNKVGNDFFYFFSMRDNKLYPGGHIALLENTDKDKYFKDKCLNAYGYGCTNWVLENENMDYFKCKDLSYYGKRRCK